MLTNTIFRKKTHLALAMLAITLSACASQANEKVAALLPSDNKQARAEIIMHISQSLGNKNIPIANDIFQQSSRLLLGKSSVTSPNGVEVFRSDEKVSLVFELLKQGDHCLLRRIDNAQEWQLTTTDCFQR